MSLVYIKDILIIFALISICIYHYESLQKKESFTQVMKAMINVTEGRLKEHEARMKYFETAMGEDMMKHFLANGEGREGTTDVKYSQMLGIISEPKRRSVSAQKPKCGNSNLSIKLCVDYSHFSLHKRAKGRGGRGGGRPPISEKLCQAARYPLHFFFP